MFCQLSVLSGHISAAPELWSRAELNHSKGCKLTNGHALDAYLINETPEANIYLFSIFPDGYSKRIRQRKSSVPLLAAPQ